MPSLSTLPTELIVEIAELLPPADIKNLSSTNRRLRHAVTHILFRTLNIACPLVSHQLLDHMLKKYERVISRIHLHIYLRPNLVSDFIERGFRIIPVSLDSDEHEVPATPSPDPEKFCDEVEMPVNSIWGTPRSDTLEKLVRGQILSHISSFSVHFDPCQFEDAGQWYGDAGDWGDENGTGGIFVFEDEEDDDEVFHRELDYIWREQYNQVFQDLTKNPNITNLRFINLLPKRTSAWSSGDWHSMLGRLTHFDIGIFGAKYDGWHGHATPGFVAFVQDLTPYIVQHLTNIKHLRLEASVLSVFGAQFRGISDDNFPLEDSMPNLQSLELKNVVLGFTFLSFLGNQRDNLRGLTLHNCMCLSPSEPQGIVWQDTEPKEVQWSDVWACVLVCCPAMRRVTFLQDERPPLTEYEVELVEYGGLMVWRHVTIDPLQGTVDEDEEANVSEVYLDHASMAYREMTRALAERRGKDESSSEA